MNPVLKALWYVEFGVTPESIRTLGTLSSLKLTEPFVMTISPLPTLNPPRIESLPRLRLAGLVERYDCKSPAGIPNQWQRFLPYFCNIPDACSQKSRGSRGILRSVTMSRAVRPMWRKTLEVAFRIVASGDEAETRQFVQPPERRAADPGREPAS